MAKFIIEIPDEYFAYYDTERDMYYPDERDSAMPITPIVLCRDCKWAKPDQSDHETREYYRCNMWIADVGANGFCSRGIRKGLGGDAE